MYTTFYGLREKPFTLSPDPRYLFLAESHREALAHLLYGIQQGEGFIAITGEVGTGKTTLSRVLLQRMPPGSEVAFILNPDLSAVDLLRAVNKEFGFETDRLSRRQINDQLNQFLLEQNREGRRVLLIIDEAQNLQSRTLEQVRLLSNLETDTSKLLQIVLLGQPELDQKLHTPALRQLKQRITVWWKLSPLGPEETQQYILHRLRIAAGAERAIFSERAIVEIHKHSGGIPRLINVLCDRALLAGYGEGAPEIDVPIIRAVQRELNSDGPSRVRAKPRLRLPRWMMLLATSVVLGLSLGFFGARYGIGDGLRSLASQIRDGASNLSQGSSRSTNLVEEALPEFAATENSELAPVSASVTDAESLEDLVAYHEAHLEKSSNPSSFQETDSVLKEIRLGSLLASTAPGVSYARSTDAALVAWNLDPMGLELLSVEDCFATLRDQGLTLLWLRSSDFGELRDLNQPALMMLSTLDKAPRLVLLQRIESDAAVIAGLQAEGELRIPLAELAEHWTAEAIIPWRDFEELPLILRPGQRGRPTYWLQTVLMEIGIYNGRATGVYDDATVIAVREFQKKVGLEVDGTVGARTKMVLYGKMRDKYSIPGLQVSGSIPAKGSAG